MRGTGRWQLRHKRSSGWRGDAPPPRPPLRRGTRPGWTRPPPGGGRGSGQPTPYTCVPWHALAPLVGAGAGRAASLHTRALNVAGVGRVERPRLAGSPLSSAAPLAALAAYSSRAGACGTIALAVAAGTRRAAEHAARDRRARAGGAGGGNARRRRRCAPASPALPRHLRSAAAVGYHVARPGPGRRAAEFLRAAPVEPPGARERGRQPPAPCGAAQASLPLPHRPRTACA